MSAQTDNALCTQTKELHGPLNALPVELGAPDPVRLGASPSGGTRMGRTVAALHFKMWNGAD